MPVEPSIVSIGIVNPKSPSNIGSILRAAGCFQVDEVLYTGTRYARAAKFQTDTKSIAQQLPLKAVECLTDHKPAQSALICVELVEGATPLSEFRHPNHAFYIFGPEDGNLSQTLVDTADEVIYIPTIGCLNLAATVNVVLYDRLAKANSTIASDSLIRRSRDTNNRLKVHNDR